MEKLLHYTWQHKLYSPLRLCTTKGEIIEVIDPGLSNQHSGPDFVNAKIKIDGTLWVGNVEIHENSKDWFRHGHQTDAAYNNVILHVVSHVDSEVTTANGRELPQFVMTVPEKVLINYEQLLQENTYPPCYSILSTISQFTIHSWLSSLVAERLETKTQRIKTFVASTAGDWERACFVTLARNFGFGVNNETFEEWAINFPLSAAGKHRDNRFQLEALFFGQAGLLDERLMTPERVAQVLADDYFVRLKKEYLYLAHKFSLTPIDGRHWRFLRLRPQNFPHIRLAQLLDIYYRATASMSKLIEAETPEQMRTCLQAQACGYWETHYRFGLETQYETKHLQISSLNLILINTIAPLLFAYGRHRFDDKLCERAFKLLENLKPEFNNVIKSWKAVGLPVTSAADSQALIQLQRNYCEKHDCLRCRFGYEYLSKRTK